MAQSIVNHFCRLCGESCFKDGRIQHTKNIYQREAPDNLSMFDRLASCGLRLEPQELKSFRICCKCFTQIKAIQASSNLLYKAFLKQLLVPIFISSLTASLTELLLYALYSTACDCCPFLPALPTCCTMSSGSSGAPYMTTCEMLGKLRPIPSAVVATTTLQFPCPLSDFMTFSLLYGFVFE